MYKVIHAHSMLRLVISLSLNVRTKKSNIKTKAKTKMY